MNIFFCGVSSSYQLLCVWVTDVIWSRLFRFQVPDHNHNPRPDVSLTDLLLFLALWSMLPLLAVLLHSVRVMETSSRMDSRWSGTFLLNSNACALLESSWRKKALFRIRIPKRNRLYIWSFVFVVMGWNFLWRSWLERPSFWTWRQVTPSKIWRRRSRTRWPATSNLCWKAARGGHENLKKEFDGNLVHNWWRASIDSDTWIRFEEEQRTVYFSRLNNYFTPVFCCLILRGIIMILDLLCTFRLIGENWRLKCLLHAAG